MPLRFADADDIGMLMLLPPAATRVAITPLLMPLFSFASADIFRYDDYMPHAS